MSVEAGRLLRRCGLRDEQRDRIKDLLPDRDGHMEALPRTIGCLAKLFERIFKLLAEDHDNEYMMIDATIVRAHQHSAGARKKTANKRSADPAAD